MNRIKKITLTGLAFISVAVFTSCERNDLYSILESQLNKTYDLRDIGPAGGLIFYINPNAAADGWTYLEAAPADLEVVGLTQFEWGFPDSIFMVNKQIGSGKDNTEGLLSGNDEWAGKAARGYGLVYNDWFLPSSGELLEMYYALHEFDLPVSTFSSVRYWSSSASDGGMPPGNMSFCINFADGSEYEDARTQAYKVRPARRF